MKYLPLRTATVRTAPSHMFHPASRALPRAKHRRTPSPSTPDGDAPLFALALPDAALFRNPARRPVKRLAGKRHALPDIPLECAGSEKRFITQSNMTRLSQTHTPNCRPLQQDFPTLFKKVRGAAWRTGAAAHRFNRRIVFQRYGDYASVTRQCPARRPRGSGSESNKMRRLRYQ